jgi:diguanylate cyclase (GGDEF)-like protein
LEEYAVNLIKRSKKFAILFVDLDQFKFINDKRGHSFGDLLLHVVGQKLLSLSNTTMMVSRYSDDKFVIIKPFEGKKEIDNFANAISSAFIDPLEVDGQEIYITPSTGISLYPLNAMNFETLYKQADTAMYAAKKQGENKFEYYSTLLNDSLKQKAELDYALRKAIINNEFTLHYQPQYNLLSGEIKGVEALIRWQNKNVKFSSPQEFIPFAEETGLILPIGDWVLRRACEEFKLLAKKYNITLSVNVSAVQLQQVNFIDKIKKTIKHTGFDPSLLTLELTESTMLKDRRIPQKLNEIRKIGVKISIDDFGTGYSSLSVLKEYPVNAVKIDRSFIKDATNDYKSKAMVKTIIDIADNLNFEIVAEGIEEVSQVELLKKLNCINGQGYLYCRPNDIKEIMKTIELNKNQNHSDNF